MKDSALSHARVVQTADVLPIFHAVFAGNTAEIKTLKHTLEKVLARF